MKCIPYQYRHKGMQVIIKTANNVETCHSISLTFQNCIHSQTKYKARDFSLLCHMYNQMCYLRALKPFHMSGDIRKHTRMYTFHYENRLLQIISCLFSLIEIGCRRSERRCLEVLYTLYKYREIFQYHTAICINV